MIVKCVCSHEAQDKLHGVGNRVANPTKSDKTIDKVRCTVCKALIDIKSKAVLHPFTKEKLSA